MESRRKSLEHDPEPMQPMSGLYSTNPDRPPYVKGEKAAPLTELEQREARRQQQSAAYWGVFFTGFGISTANKLLLAPLERIKLLMQCEVRLGICSNGKSTHLPSVGRINSTRATLYTLSEY